jgi:hypothetical protein
MASQPTASCFNVFLIVSLAIVADVALLKSSNFKLAT